MISNYLYTIGKHLSFSQRDEVLKELEANLYDYLVENFGEKEYTDIEIEQAIKSMGHPKKVAEAYMNRPRCLIGNTYIDTYWLVIKIAVLGTTIGIITSVMLDVADIGNGIQFFVKLFIQIWQSSLYNVGIVTVIFAVINYYSPQDSIRTEEQWSLSVLETAPESANTVSITELVVESFFICVGLVVLNQPSFITSLENLNITVIPLINMAHFTAYIPWINGFLFAWLILNINLLIKKQWQMRARKVCILINVIGIALFTKLVLDPDMFDILATPNNINWSRNTIYIIFVVFVSITCFEIYKHLRALLKKK